MTAYITLPPQDATYLNKVYTIYKDGEQVSKRVGIKKAIGTFKYIKYSNFHSTVSLYNTYTKELVKQL